MLNTLDITILVIASIVFVAVTLLAFINGKRDTRNVSAPSHPTPPTIQASNTQTFSTIRAYTTLRWLQLVLGNDVTMLNPVDRFGYIQFGVTCRQMPTLYNLLHRHNIQYEHVA